MEKFIIKNGELFNSHQIAEIKNGIKSKIDTTIYSKIKNNKPVYNSEQMYEIRQGLEYNKKHPDNPIDVEQYTNPELDNEQMEIIRHGLQNNINVSAFAKKGCNRYQLLEIFEGIKENLDVSAYAKAKYTANQMRRIRQELSKKAKQKLAAR